MQQKFITNKIAIYTVFFMAIGLAFTSCSNNPFIDKNEKIEWVVLHYQFKPGTSKEQIYMAKAEIDDYINKYLQMNNANNVILGITSKYVIYETKKGPALGVKIFLYCARGDGTRVPKPPPPPPVKISIGLFNGQDVFNKFN